MKLLLLLSVFCVIAYAYAQIPCTTLYDLKLVNCLNQTSSQLVSNCTLPYDCNQLCRTIAKYCVNKPNNNAPDYCHLTAFTTTPTPTSTSTRTPTSTSTPTPTYTYSSSATHTATSTSTSTSTPTSTSTSIPSPTPTVPFNEATCLSNANNLYESALCDYLEPFYANNVANTSYNETACQSTPPFSASFAYLGLGTLNETIVSQYPANLCAQQLYFQYPHLDIHVKCDANYPYQYFPAFGTPYPTPLPYSEIFIRTFSFIQSDGSTTSPIGLVIVVVSDSYFSNWNQVLSDSNDNNTALSPFPDTEDGFGLQTNCIASLGSIWVNGGYGYMPDAYGILNSWYVQVVVLLQLEIDSYDYVFGIQPGMVSDIQRTQVLLYDCLLTTQAETVLNPIDITLYTRLNLVMLGIWDYHNTFSTVNFFAYLSPGRKRAAPSYTNTKYFALSLSYVVDSTSYDLSALTWTYNFPSLEYLLINLPLTFTGTIDDSFFSTLSYCLITGTDTTQLYSVGGYCGLSRPPSCVNDATTFGQLQQCDYLYSYYLNNTAQSYDVSACKNSPTYAATVAVAGYSNVLYESENYNDYFTELPALLCGQTYSAPYVTLYTSCSPDSIYGDSLSFLPVPLVNQDFNEIFFTVLSANNGEFSSSNPLGFVYFLTSQNGDSGWYNFPSYGIATSSDPFQTLSFPLQLRCMTSLGSIFVQGYFTYIANSIGLFNSHFIKSIVLKNVQLDDYTAVTQTGRTQIILENTVIGTIASVNNVDLNQFISENLINLHINDPYSVLVFDAFFENAIETNPSYAPDLSYLSLQFTAAYNPVTYDLSTILWSTNFPNLTVLSINVPLTVTGILDDSFFANLAYCSITNYIGTLYSSHGYCDLPPPPPTCINQANNYTELLQCDYLYEDYLVNERNTPYNLTLCQTSQSYAATVQMGTYGSLELGVGQNPDATSICTQTFFTPTNVTLVPVCNALDIIPQVVDPLASIAVPTLTYDQLYYSDNGDLPAVSENLLGLQYTIRQLGTSDTISPSDANWGLVWYDLELGYVHEDLPIDYFAPYTYQSEFELQFQCLAGVRALVMQGYYSFIGNEYDIFDMPNLQSVVVQSMYFSNSFSLNTVAAVGEGFSNNLRTRLIFDDCAMGNQNQLFDIAYVFSPSLVVLEIYNQFNNMNFNNILSTNGSSPLAPDLTTWIMRFTKSTETAIDIASIDWAYNYPSLQTFYMDGPWNIYGELPAEYFANVPNCLISNDRSTLTSQSRLCGLPTISGVECLVSASNFGELQTCDYLYSFYLANNANTSYSASACELSPTYAASIAVAVYGSVEASGNAYDSIFASLGLSLCDTVYSNPPYVQMTTTCSTNNIYPDDLSFLPTPLINQNFFSLFNYVFEEQYYTLSTTNPFGFVYVLGNANGYNSWADLIISGNGYSSTPINVPSNFPVQISCIQTLGSISISGGYVYLPDAFNIFDSTNIESIVLENVQLDDYVSLQGPGRSQIILENVISGSVLNLPPNVDFSVFLGGRLSNLHIHDAHSVLDFDNFYSLVTNNINYPSQNAFDYLSYLSISFNNVNADVTYDFSQILWSTWFPNLQVLYINAPLNVNGTITDSSLNYLQYCNITGYIGNLYHVNGACGLPTPPTCVQEASNFAELQQCDYMFSFYQANNGASFSESACQSSPTYAASVAVAAYGYVFEESGSNYDTYFGEMSTNLCSQNYGTSSVTMQVACTDSNIYNDDSFSFLPSVLIGQNFNNIFSLLVSAFGSDSNGVNPLGFVYEFTSNSGQSWSGLIDLGTGYSNVPVNIPEGTVLAASCILSLGSIYVSGDNTYLPNAYNVFSGPNIQSIVLEDLQLDDYSQIAGDSRTQIILQNTVIGSLTAEPFPTVDINMFLVNPLINFYINDQYSVLDFDNFYAYATQDDVTFMPNLLYLAVTFTSVSTSNTYDFSQILLSANFPSLQVLYINAPLTVTGTMTDALIPNLIFCQITGYNGNVYDQYGICAPIPPGSGSGSGSGSSYGGSSGTCESNAPNFAVLQECDYAYEYYLYKTFMGFNSNACQQSATYAASVAIAAFGYVFFENSSPYDGTFTSDPASICSQTYNVNSFVTFSSYCDGTTLYGDISFLPFALTVTDPYTLFYNSANVNGANFGGFPNPASFIYQLQNSISAFNWNDVIEYGRYGVSSTAVQLSFPVPVFTECITTLGSIYIDGGFTYVPDSYNIFASQFVQSIVLKNVQLQDYTPVTGSGSSYDRTQLILYNIVSTSLSTGYALDLTLFMQPSLINLLVYDPVATLNFAGFYSNLIGGWNGIAYMPTLNYLSLQFNSVSDDTIYDLGQIDWTNNFGSLQVLYLNIPLHVTGVIPDSFFCNLLHCNITGYIGYIQSPSGCCGVPSQTCIEAAQTLGQAVLCDYTYPFYLADDASDIDTATCQSSGVQAASLAMILYGNVTASALDDVTANECSQTFNPTADFELTTTCGTLDFLDPNTFLPYNIQQSFQGNAIGGGGIISLVFELTNPSYTGTFNGITVVPYNSDTNEQVQLDCINALASIDINGSFTYVPNGYLFADQGTIISVIIKDTQLDAYLPCLQQCIFYNTVISTTSQYNVDIYSIGFSINDVPNYEVVNYVFVDAYASLIFDAFYAYAIGTNGGNGWFESLSYFYVETQYANAPSSGIPFDMSQLHSEYFPNLSVFILNTPLQLTGTIDDSFFQNLVYCNITGFTGNVYSYGSYCGLSPPPSNGGSGSGSSYGGGGSCISNAGNFAALQLCDNSYEYYQEQTLYNFNQENCQASSTYAASVAYAGFGSVYFEPGGNYDTFFAEYPPTICSQVYYVPNEVVTFASFCDGTTLYGDNNLDFLPFPFDNVSPSYLFYNSLNANDQQFGYGVNPSSFIYQLYNTINAGSWSDVIANTENGISSVAVIVETIPVQIQCLTTLGSVYIQGGYTYIPDTYNIFNSDFVQVVAVTNGQLDDYQSFCNYDRTQIILYNTVLTGLSGGYQVYLASFMLSSLYNLVLYDPVGTLDFVDFYYQMNYYFGFGFYMPNLNYLYVQFNSVSDNTVYDFGEIAWDNFGSLQNLYLNIPIYATGVIPDSFFNGLENCVITGYTGYLRSPNGNCGLPSQTCVEIATNLEQEVQCDFSYLYYLEQQVGNMFIPHCQQDATQAATLSMLLFANVTAPTLSSYSANLCQQTYSPTSDFTLSTSCTTDIYPDLRFLPYPLQVPFVLDNTNGLIAEITINITNPSSINDWADASNFSPVVVPFNNTYNYNAYSACLPSLQSLYIDGDYTYVPNSYLASTLEVGLENGVFKNVQVDQYSGLCTTQCIFFNTIQSLTFNYVNPSQVGFTYYGTTTPVNIVIVDAYATLFFDSFFSDITNTNSPNQYSQLSYFYLDFQYVQSTNNVFDFSQIQTSLFPQLKVFILNAPLSLTGVLDDAFFSTLEYCSITGYSGNIYSPGGYCNLPTCVQVMNETVGTLAALATCDVMYPIFTRSNGQYLTYPTNEQCQSSPTQAATLLDFSLYYLGYPYTTYYSISAVCGGILPLLGMYMWKVSSSCSLGVFSSSLSYNYFQSTTAYSEYSSVWPIYFFDSSPTQIYTQTTGATTSDYLTYEMIIATTRNFNYIGPGYEFTGFSSWNLVPYGVNQHNMPNNIDANCLTHLAFLYVQGENDFNYGMSIIYRRAPILQKLTVVQTMIESYEIVFGTDSNVVAQRTEVIVYDCVLYDANLILNQDGLFAYQQYQLSYSDSDYNKLNYQSGSYEGTTPSSWSPATVQLVKLFAPSIVNFMIIDYTQIGSLARMDSMSPVLNLQYLMIYFYSTTQDTINIQDINFPTTFPNLKTLYIIGSFCLTGNLLSSDASYWGAMNACVFQDYTDLGLIDQNSICILDPGSGAKKKKSVG